MLNRSGNRGIEDRGVKYHNGQTNMGTDLFLFPGKIEEK